MYRPSQKIIHIDLEQLRSHDGTWRIDCRLKLALPAGSWDDLDITDTLDYGALAGQLRFILDCLGPAQVEATIAAYGNLLPQLFPALNIIDYSLTITSSVPIIACEGCALWLGTWTEFLKTTLQKNPASAVLVCSGAGAGEWFLSPYANGERFESSALFLAVPYTGYLPTAHFKANYYQYPPDFGEAHV